MIKATKNNLEYITKDKGIYMIWTLLKESYYIGSTKNFRKRYSEHYNMLRRNKHNNKKLQNFVNKYGIDKLEFCIHIVDNSLETKELRKLEENEIKYFDTFKNGFNLTENTESPLKDIIWTKEMRKNLSEKAKLRQTDPKVKAEISIRTSGERGPHKLKDKEVDYIRENIKWNKNKSKMTNKLDLCKKFNVNPKTIYRIVKNKTRLKKTQW